MSNRPNPRTIADRPLKALHSLFGYVHSSSLEETLTAIVYLRVSQINGCAYCMNLHALDLVRLGVAQEKVTLLPAWREVDAYTAREKSGLAWAEYLTKLTDTAFVPDSVYNAARDAFTEQELIDLTWATATMNTANRLNVAFQVPPEQG